jgi:hypothetical protein
VAGRTTPFSPPTPQGLEGREEGICLKIVFFEPHQHADPPHAFALLRPRRNRLADFGVHDLLVYNRRQTGWPLSANREYYWGAVMGTMAP